MAALPCSTAACKVHAAIGFVIVGGWFLLFVFGLGAWILRREPGRPFWRLLAILQVLLVIQLIAGSVLLAAGHRADSLLHYLFAGADHGSRVALSGVSASGSRGSRIDNQVGERRR